MRNFNWNFMAIVVVLVPLFGCGKGTGPQLPKAKVEGRVTFRGEPLKIGRISFTHPSGHAVAADLTPDGKYSVEAFQGQNRVAINSREADRPNPNKMPAVLPGKSLIPEKFNEPQTSGLTCDILEGENTHDFDLK